VSTNGSSSLTSTYTRYAGAASALSAAATTSSVAVVQVTLVAPACGAHVEQVADHPIQAVGRLIDVVQQAAAVFRAEAHVALHQARHRRLDGCEWGAQVVRHGLQQRGAKDVGLRQRLDRRGLAAQPLRLHRQ
jgi:hypothetical protein